ncbi:MAG: GGDEF domain-containing protein, partial [Candidatus Binatia bacterium]
ILKRIVRESEFIARIGGEEFAVILPETELAGAVQAGNRLRLEIRDQAIETPKGLLVITVSVGTTSNAGSDGADLERLYSDADQALYVAKHNGKNQVAVLPGRSLEQPDPIVLN